MPGINAVFQKRGGKPVSSDFCAQLRRAMLHFSFYQSRLVLEEEWVNIGFTGYKEYPFQIINHDDFILVLEGRIYNLEKAQLEKELRYVAQEQLMRKEAACNELKRFLLAADGEFIFTLFDKINSRLTMANDVMGRLPLYYHEENGLLIFSRELKFILPFLPEVMFSKKAILEYLLYGFPFGKHTLVETVGFFPPATCLTFDLSSGNAIKESYFPLNLEKHRKPERRKKIVAKMHEVFIETLSNRMNWVDKSNVIVSLSGGLDSRGTLAGIKKLGVTPVAVTAKSEEEQSARRVASDLGIEVYGIPQGGENFEFSFEDIVFLKDGLDCHPDLSQLYQNLQDMRNKFNGDVVYFTGIYGGEITRQSHLTGGLPSLKALFRYLLNANDSYKYSTEKVGQILKITRKKIERHLLNHLRELPEKNVYRKYLRFRHEFDLRFAGEAEDRNRFYFWTISPYFAFPFFRYVMGINENQKNSRLFRDFLFSIDPDTCKAGYYNYHLPLKYTPILFLWAFAERATRHAFIKNSIRLIKGLLGTFLRIIRPLSKEELSRIMAQKHELICLLQSTPAISNFFDNPDLKKLILDENDTRGLERLRIIFSYMKCAVQWHMRIVNGIESFVPQTNTPV